MKDYLQTKGFRVWEKELDGLLDKLFLDITEGGKLLRIDD